MPLFRSTSALVYLDVTVVDKSGHVVMNLTKDDFSITEDGKSQNIFSFEAPQAHGLSDGHDPKDDSAKSQAPAQAGQAPPKTILVLDQLNTRYDDFESVRDQARKFLQGQPEMLPAPAEMMVLGNASLQVVAEETRSQETLLKALDHIQRSVPFKANYQWNFMSELITRSYDALQQISIRNRGVPGRKNVIWLGMGPPAIDDSRLSDPNRESVRLYVRDTVNRMVESRITLFQIYPQVEVIGTAVETKTQGKDFATGKNSGESFTPTASGNRRFADFVDGTGGKLFNENDVDVALGKSLELGASYFTLTYQPQNSAADGRFRKIRVALRNPALRAMTKVGYFARDKDEAGTDKPVFAMLGDAAAATLPFSALEMRVAEVVRHPDTGSVEITVEIDDGRLHWQAGEDGASGTALLAIAKSRSAHGDVLSSQGVRVPLVVQSQKPEELALAKPKFKLTLPLPRDAKSVRVAVAVDDGGRIGAVDLDRKTLDAAPEAATNDPKLRSGRKKAAKQ